MSDGYLFSTDGGCDMNATWDELLGRWVQDGDMEVIPSVGRKVYIVSIDSKQISEEEVYALGKDSFLLKGYRNYKENYGELLYSQYYSKWFLDFNEAAAHLSKYLRNDEKLEEEGFEGVWNVTKL